MNTTHAPSIITTESWEDRALCCGPQAYLWDDTLEGAHETPKARQARHAMAIMLCLDCPARQFCASTITPEDTGVRDGRLLVPRSSKRMMITAGQPCVTCSTPMMPCRSNGLPPGYRRHQAHGECRACVRRKIATSKRNTP